MQAVISASTSQELRDSGSHDDKDYGRRVGLLCEWQKGKWQLAFGLEILLSEEGPVSLLLCGHFDLFWSHLIPLKGIAVVW